MLCGLPLAGATAMAAVTSNLNYTVVIPEQASQIEVFAAQELSSFLGKIYSRDVALNGSTEPIVFYVGTGAEAERAGFAGRTFCDDESMIARCGRSFLFDGYDDASVILSEFGRVGTLTAVYVFLEKYTGLEFFFPGEAGYRLPENPELRFASNEEVFKPSFPVRGFNPITTAYSESEMLLFSRRMLCSRPNWHRSKRYGLSDWKERFGETQPELLARDESGKALSFKFRDKLYYSPCFTSDQAVQQAARDVIKMFDSDTSLISVHFMDDVPWLACRCERCTASPLRMQVSGNDYSEEYFNFVARVGELVFAACPDRVLITHTKTTYPNPPVATALDKRIVVEILFHKGQAFKPAVLPDYRQYLLKWNQSSGLTNIVLSRANSAKFDRNWPLIMPRHTARALINVHGLTTGDHGMSLLCPVYPFYALNVYVHCKVLADIDADIEQMIKEFVGFAYPGAEAPMYDFYAEMENIWAATPLDKGFEDPLLTIYTPESLARPREFLKAARETASKLEYLDPLYSSFMDFYTLVENRSRSVKKAQE
jgi:hypothetical protein